MKNQNTSLDRFQDAIMGEEWGDWVRELDWGTRYPIVEIRDGTVCVVGVVDSGNSLDGTTNQPDWHTVDVIHSEGGYRIVERPNACDAALRDQFPDGCPCCGQRNHASNVCPDTYH